MARSIADQVLERLQGVGEMYHRLLLIVAPSGSGKTAALQDVARQTGAPLLNVNLEVSRGLLDLTERRRALELAQLVQDVVGGESAVVLLDNIEILFDVSFQQDPLRLLRGLSRNRTVVAAWNGTVDNGHLLYATPGHPEYRRYPAGDLVVVRPEVAA